jgi:HD-GYP domain-containing protein (c-di-GMP phosphodiesterase class II)
MAVVDVYDALRTERPYKFALSHKEAVDILWQETEAGSWDPQVAKIFIDMLRHLTPYHS